MDAVELGELDKVVLLISSKTGKVLLLLSKVSDVNHTASILLRAVESLPQLNPD